MSEVETRGEELPRLQVKPVLMMTISSERIGDDYSMKTVKPVDEATKAKIGKANLICSQYPDVFGDVTMKKFCAMFVDVVDEDDDEHEARIKAEAESMYWMLRNMLYELKRGSGKDADYLTQMIDDIGEVLSRIDGEDACDE